jgi:hypothetical protein
MGVSTGCRRGRIWNDSSSSTGVDKDLLGDRRGDHNRLGLMLQTTTVRYVGRFLEDPLDVPWPVVVPAGVRFSEMAQFSRAWPRPQGSGVS